MIDYLDINEQQHLMSAEGTANMEPSVGEIESAIRLRGYGAENISVSHDGLQQIWRFTARILKLDDMPNTRLKTINHIEERFYSLLHDLRDHYAAGIHSFSPCVKCKVNSARGGHCAECIELDIAEITTPSLAWDLHGTIKDQARAIKNITEYLDE